jgi:hypothetical protein
MTRALNIPGADAKLLYAANTVRPDQFLVSDGSLVGVHPHRAIQDSFDTDFQVGKRSVVSTIAFFIWSAMVTVFAKYSSWFQQAPMETVVATLVGLVLLFAGIRRFELLRARDQKEKRINTYLQLAFVELNKTHWMLITLLRLKKIICGLGLTPAVSFVRER